MDHRINPARACARVTAFGNIPWTALAATVAGVLVMAGPAMAGDISSGSTYKASALGNSLNPDFKGGTLLLDSTTTITQNFTVETYTGNTIDIDGHTVTMSGAFTGAGPLTFSDSVGGGIVTLTASSNAYTGVTTVNSGAVLALGGTGTIADSAGLVDNGTFDISATTSGASVTTLSGTGNVVLGSQILSISDGGGLFSGVITGTGSLKVAGGTEIITGTNTYSGGTVISSGTLEVGDGGTTGSIIGNASVVGTLAFNRSDDISFDGVVSGTGGVSQLGSGTLTLTAANSYTGTTTISAGTLALSSTGSVAGSSVADGGIFDISATGGASIKSLSGAGTVEMGASTLTITAASGSFSGTLEGSGSVVVTGGTQLFSGSLNYTGTTSVTGGTLVLGSASVDKDIANSSLVSFQTSGVVDYSGVISGSGSISTLSGTTVISAAQTYTGVTTLTAGTLELSGSGSIANSSNVSVTGTLDISSAGSDVAITSLAGTGSVVLGSRNLDLTGAFGTFTGVLSGSGGVTLASGNEILSGTNTYTGDTVISGGTLALGSSSAIAHSTVVDNSVFDISQVSSASGTTTATIISLAGSGSVVLGEQTLLLSNAADAFSGSISGAGGLTVSSGVETLTGANTYAGSTTINSGTLALTGSGSLLSSGKLLDYGVFDISGVTGSSTVTLGTISGTGTVVLGGENLNISNGSTSFTGTISGTGELIVSGGTQILGGGNTYSGGTLINGGTLQIGLGAGSGSIVGDVTDNGTLKFNRTGSLAFGGNVSGNGQLVQAGSGTTILTGTNTYSGGTTISAGALQIGNGGTTGSIAGDVTDNGTLAFARTDATTFGGTISGTGGVSILSGDMIFTASESYAGATVVSNLASLTLTGSANIAQSSGATVNGTLDLSGMTVASSLVSLSGSGSVIMGSQDLTITNGSGTFSGVITGTGGLMLAGGSGEVLSGTNSYTGATVINGGTLSVNGSIASSSGVTVNSGGTLAGSGTVSGVTLASGASIAPGSNGTGTLTVNGNVAFSSGSLFVVNMANSSAGKLSVSGAEALSGTLSVVSLDGTYAFGQKLTVLTASGGVSGTFAVAPIVSTGAQYKTVVSYDANDVYVEVNLAKLSPLLPGGASPGASNAVNGIDAAIAAGDTLPQKFQALGTLSAAALETDAGQLASEVGSDVTQAGNSLVNPFLTAMFDHIADLQPTGAFRSQMPQDDGIWATALISTQIVDGDSALYDTHRMRASVTGFVAGGDWNVAPSTRLGFAVSTGSSDFRLASDVGQGRATAFQLGVYGLTQFSRHFYGSFAGALALDDVKTQRTIDVSGTDTLQGKVTARMIGGRYETGAQLGWIMPYVAVQDVLFDTPKYTETALSGSDGFALTFAGQTTNYANAELGLRQRVDVHLDDWTLNLSDRLAWKLNMSGIPAAEAAFAALPDSTFTSYGASGGRNAVLFSLGAGLHSAGGFGIDFHFDSDISDKSQSYTEGIGLRYTW
ncbi:MAG: autotransporter-associated beta strand repeat-containing protein [Proteobacteria bacterium]|nr:autotransporter-associated beta strand repeat-containing protein [Pseudomonadota bacterium]